MNRTPAYRLLSPHSIIRAYLSSKSCLCCMKKTYQFRIYPNGNSEVNSLRTLTTCRKLYNEKLAERKRQAELNRLRKSFDVFPWGKPEWIDYYEQKLDLTATKTPFQKEVLSEMVFLSRSNQVSAHSSLSIQVFPTEIHRMIF